MATGCLDSVAVKDMASTEAATENWAGFSGAVAPMAEGLEALVAAKAALEECLVVAGTAAGTNAPVAPVEPGRTQQSRGTVRSLHRPIQGDSY